MNNSEELVNSAVRKGRRHLLPVLIVMYVMSILDRVNVGFAKSAYQADTGLSDAAFALGAGIFFLSYAVFEVPSNVILARVGPRVWLCRIMVTWGLVAAGMMFATTEHVFYAMRFLLGIAEAGFYPGVILTLTYWFPAHARAQANGILLFGFAGALVIGGPLSGALLELNGFAGLKGWEWMFLIEGLMAVVVGIGAYFLLENSPGEASWLTVEEKRALQEALDKEAREKAVHSPKSLLRTLSSPKILYFALTFFSVQIAAYGLIFYLPTQVAVLLGQKVGLTVGLVSSIPWVVASVAVYFVTRWSDRNRQLRRTVVSALFGLFAACIFLSADGTPTFAIAMLSIGASAYLCGSPILFAFISEHLSGIGFAAGIALVNSIGNLGGFVAPSLRTFIEQQAGASAGLYALGAAALISSALLLLMPRSWRNVAAKGVIAQPV